jgi:hypothetical protein
MRAAVATLLCLAARAAADPTPIECDPKAPVGDVKNPVGRYMCQLDQDGHRGPRYPCEIITVNRAGAVDPYDWWFGAPGASPVMPKGAPCGVTGKLRAHDGVAIDGWLACDPIWPEIGHEAELAGKLQPIAGGFRYETRTEIHLQIRTDAPDSRRPHVVWRELPVKLGLSICRQPWPAGFVAPRPDHD